MYLMWLIACHVVDLTLRKPFSLIFSILQPSFRDETLRKPKQRVINSEAKTSKKY